MLQLYGHPFSSYTWKAQIALLANGNEHDFRMIDPGHPDNSSFVGTAHPAGKFPILTDGENTVIEASAIIEYLAVHHPGTAPLIPDNPAHAATARMLDRVFDNYVMANMSRVVLAFIKNGENPDQNEIASAKVDLLRAYRWLEDWLAQNAPPQHVSLVTCAAAPSLFYADWIEQIPQECPNLVDLRAELLALPAVVTCVDGARPYRHLFPPGAPDRD